MDYDVFKEIFEINANDNLVGRFKKGTITIKECKNGSYFVVCNGDSTFTDDLESAYRFAYLNFLEEVS